MSEDIIEKVKAFTEQVIAEEPEYFLVGVKIKPTNNIKVYLDGDKGITIEKCIQVNRKLYKIIEESGIVPPDNFSLEVSSPGIDSPLVLHRQFVKNKGRLLEVILSDESETTLTGKLIEISDQAITLEIKTGKGKKEVVEQKEILFDNINKAIVQIQF